jgi:hypothetical protein
MSTTDFARVISGSVAVSAILPGDKGVPVLSLGVLPWCEEQISAREFSAVYTGFNREEFASN